MMEPPFVPVPFAALQGGAPSVRSAPVLFAAAVQRPISLAALRRRSSFLHFLLFYFFTFLHIQIQAASLCVGSISLSFSSSPVKARRTPMFVYEPAEPP